MAESHVVSGLVAKRSKLTGSIQHHQEAMLRLSVAIGNIDGAIRKHLAVGHFHNLALR